MCVCACVHVCVRFMLCRQELGKEVVHVSMLNQQLAAAEDALRAKDSLLQQVLCSKARR